MQSPSQWWVHLHRVGLRLCISHACIDGTQVDVHSSRPFIYTWAPGQIPIHQNNVIARAFVSAGVPVIKESISLARQDDKRPNGLMLIPWQRGRPLTWWRHSGAPASGLLCERSGSLGWCSSWTCGWSEDSQMMIVDLYSALHRAPLLRYVSQCIVKRNVFTADRKDPMLSDGSRRWSAAGSRPSDLPRRIQIRRFGTDCGKEAWPLEWVIYVFLFGAGLKDYLISEETIEGRAFFSSASGSLFNA